MSLDYKNILVTGGSGFIGSNFIHYILNKYEINVFNLDKLTYAGNNNNHIKISKFKNYKFLNGDICDANLVKNIINDHSIDSIVHFAAESHVDKSIEDPYDFLNTNIIGTYNLLRESLEHYKNGNKITFLHVSTDEVYGSLEIDDHAFTETNRFLPNSPYSASKASSDLLVRAWHHTYGLPTLTTNCSNNYGPYQFPEKLIPLIINKAIRFQPLTVYGDGQNIRDWLHVKDHCRGITKVLKSGVYGETYNIGGNNEYSNMEIVHTVCEILEELRPYNNQGHNSKKSYKDLIVFTKDRLGHDFRYSINSSKISSKLGWEPKIGFKNGLRETVQWYLNNQDWVEDIYKK
jgi:dTDP-glucose 4,6-dehydratase